MSRRNKNKRRKDPQPKINAMVCYLLDNIKCIKQAVTTCQEQTGRLPAIVLLDGGNNEVVGFSSMAKAMPHIPEQLKKDVLERDGDDDCPLLVLTPEGSLLTSCRETCLIADLPEGASIEGNRLTVSSECVETHLRQSIAKMVDGMDRDDLIPHAIEHMMTCDEITQPIIDGFRNELKNLCEKNWIEVQG